MRQDFFGPIFATCFFFFIGCSCIVTLRFSWVWFFICLFFKPLSFFLSFFYFFLALTPSNPLNLLDFQVSSSFSILMVDFSLVWLDFPPISFFFNQLCFFLQTSYRKHSQAGACVTQETPLREVLLSLYPLVHFSIGFAQSLENRVMSRDRVRSSDLEIGLSFSEKTIVQEMDTTSFHFLTFQAWKEVYGYLTKDYDKIRDRISNNY